MSKQNFIEKCVTVRNIVHDINACMTDDITITKVIVGVETTRLEMTATSITKIRNAIEKQRQHINSSELTIVTHDQIVINNVIYIVSETKRDFGLFAGGNSNYIVVKGVFPHFKPFCMSLYYNYI
jgi:hypothetical protein